MEVFTMRKLVVFLVFAILTAMLSGCILSKTPGTNDFTMTLGEQKTFSLEVFPTPSSYVWTLDGAPVSNSGKSYKYTAQAGGHLLIVLATHALGTDTHAWYIYGNSPPVANAGADKLVHVDTTVIIDGTSSTDPDNNIVSYNWHQISGPTVTLNNADKAIANFTAFVTTGSVLTFELTVTDAYGLSNNDTCIIAPVIRWTKITGGAHHTVSIKTDGSLWAWGFNYFGQLGDGTIYDKHVPTRIGTDTDWVTVAAGEHYTLAIKADGSLWAWGDNGYGQLGNGTTQGMTAPIRIGTDTDWATVATMMFHTVAIKTDGSLWAWGLNNYGQFGDGTTVSKLIPTRIGTDTNWAVVSAGLGHTLAIKTDGSLWAWGWNNYRQLGDGTGIDKHTPTRIDADTDWATVAAGFNNTVAIKTDGSLWEWGDDVISVPMQIGTDVDWVTVAARSDHYVAIKINGLLWEWGTPYGVPLQIGIDYDWATVGAGWYHTLVIKTNGTLWAWGYNGYGELGDGTYGNDKTTPTRIGTDTDW
jgi:alpha-tubulin suppressor-like RCC1 family protein